jgi:hypothetical protein
LLLAETRRELGRERDLVLWLNAKGQKVGDQFRVLPGLTRGSCDLLGMLAMPVRDFDTSVPFLCARFIALEAKTGTARGVRKGKSDDDQKLFMELVRSKGGFAAYFSTVEEARACIERARRGESS